MIPLVTGSAFVISIVWWFVRKIGRLVDRLIDPRIDQLAEWIDQKIASIPTIAKRQILRIGGRCLRLGLQGFVIYLAIYLTLPVLLAQHLTLRQSVILAQASLIDESKTDASLEFFNKNFNLLISLPDPPRNALWLSDHQRLVGMGILEDGAIEFTKEGITSTQGVKADVMRYHIKLTRLGKRTVWWRFCILEKFQSHR